MVVEQIASGMVELRHGQLVIDLGLNETLLGLGQLVLRVQNEENRLGTEFVFALVGMERFFCQVLGDFGSFHGEFGLFERMHRIGDFERDALVGATLLVLVAAAANQGVGKSGLGGVPPDGQIERKRGAVGRIGKVKSLAETITETRTAGLLWGSGVQVELIAGYAVPGVERRQFEVRFQVVVRQANGQLIAGKLFPHDLELRSIGESACEGSGDVDARQLTGRPGLVGKVEIQSAKVGVEVCANVASKGVRKLFERIFGRNDTDAP